MRRSFLLMVTLLLVPLSAAQAQQSVTTRDIIELNKAGLAEEVLLALIEVNRSVFPVDTETLKSLKDAGVPAKVIVAMVKSGRDLPVPPPLVEQVAPQPEVAPQPPVVYVEPAQDEPRTRVIYEDRFREVAFPVYGPVYSRPIVRPDHKPAEPVYWGWGGKRRPDSWKTAADIQKDAKVPREPQKK